jgi:hypothetical protein
MLIVKAGRRGCMGNFKHLPRHQLTHQHIGKPMKLVLKNGEVIYGAIKEVRNNGIIFIPVNTPLLKKHKADSKGFFPFIFFPIFLPFLFFIPFLIL